MSVSTIANFQSAVAAVSPASKNVYNLTYNPTNPNGSVSCQLFKNGVAFLSNFVYGGAQSGSAQDFFGPWDQNTSGIVVSFTSPDGVHIESLDAQQFINSFLL